MTLNPFWCLGIFEETNNFLETTLPALLDKVKIFEKSGTQTFMFSKCRQKYLRFFVCFFFLEKLSHNKNINKLEANIVRPLLNIYKKKC